MGESSKPRSRRHKILILIALAGGLFVGCVTKPAAIDKTLAHREAKQLTSPFEPRAPGAALGGRGLVT